MIKKSVIISILFIFIGVLAIAVHPYFRPDSSEPVTGPAREIAHPTPAVPLTPGYPTVSVGGTEYAYMLIGTKGVNSVRLLPNFELKKVASELALEEGCTRYVNGSYYDSDGKPLGLFETGGNTLRSEVRSTLMNGFVWQNNSGMRFISHIRPGSADWIVQSGPMLIADGQVLELTINQDEPARRAVALTDNDGNLFFSVVFNADSVMTGPYLSDLPGIVSEIAALNGMQTGFAINLDGGSASAAGDGRRTLSEFTPVGSIFCISDN